jgi:SAM-dependent methyltransferase
MEPRVEVNGHDVEPSHYVSGNWPPEGHPLYSDDARVASVTDWLLERGQTIFQLFMLAQGDEHRHSLRVLQRVNVPLGARVLSLGCGVGGMEAYWQAQRRDLCFTLVNASKAQLVRCLCQGLLIQADMQDPDLAARLPRQDLVVLGYSLHHAYSVPAMLAVARSYLKPRGTLLVLDVCDTSERFNDAVQYRGLDSGALDDAGLARQDHGMQWHRLPAGLIGEHVAEVLDAGEATPGLWVGGPP